jgi:uncharacterized protein
MLKMNTVNKIKKFVEGECKKPSSKYGYEPFSNHFIPAIKYAEKLISTFSVKKPDREVILISVWLHDIGSIVYGREDHHITGAKIAEEKLKELKFPIEKIELVKKCIYNHRGSQQNKRESIEEKIVAEADTLSNFDNLPGIFKAAFIYENKTQDEARKSVREKLERKYQQLHFEESKELIKPKIEAVKLLLGEDN